MRPSLGPEKLDRTGMIPARVSECQLTEGLGIRD
jgi:hypothetical protein